jgi:hypothetical protein
MPQNCKPVNQQIKGILILQIYFIAFDLLRFMK